MYPIIRRGRKRRSNPNTFLPPHMSDAIPRSRLVTAAKSGDMAATNKTELVQKPYQSFE
jgi:hypothetical protein|tara:strand:+ start:197 stop:373 length:177 start_codon:yes stop_codon:yes gene_type:complete